jgi:hypothetical protein
MTGVRWAAGGPKRVDATMPEILDLELTEVMPWDVLAEGSKTVAEITYTCHVWPPRVNERGELTPFSLDFYEAEHETEWFTEFERVRVVRGLLTPVSDHYRICPECFQTMDVGHRPWCPRLRIDSTQAEGDK